MNLFDKEFYPTPGDVVKKMAEPYADTIATATILEPSAGSGAILDVLTKEGLPRETTWNGERTRYIQKADPKRVYAIEKNPELTMILQQKGYKVIAPDFLTFRPEHRFDLIIMNPPFSNGDDHLLHAWDILQGGDIACLLNAETVRNPYTASRRRLATVIAEHGNVEYIGQAFRNADNPTDAEIALVRLHKETTEDPFRIDPAGFAREQAPDFGEMAREGDTPAVANRLDAYLRSWELTKGAAQELIKAYSTFLFFSSAFLDSSEKGERGKNLTEYMLKSLQDLRFSTSTGLKNAYNDFLDTAKQRAWGVIFDQIGLGKYMTTGLKKKLDEFRHAQGAVELSKENINNLFRFIMTNINTIMDQSVIEVYDMFTRYYDGNTAHDEGWKTNKRFRCNRKVILPNVAEAGFKPEIYGYDPYFSLSYRCSGISDIDKAMCWLTGRNYDSLNSNQFYGKDYRGPSDGNCSIARTITMIPVGSTEWHESAFFRVKAFKKGTVHLEFKDEALWAKFNICVNEGKNQIGMQE